MRTTTCVQYILLIGICTAGWSNASSPWIVNRLPLAATDLNRYSARWNQRDRERPFHSNDFIPSVPFIPRGGTSESPEQFTRGGSSTKTMKKKSLATPLVDVTPLTPVGGPSDPGTSPAATTTTTTASKAVKHETKRQKMKRHQQIAKQLKNRNHTNLRRKILHASFGLFFCGLNHVIPKARFVPGMTILTSATLLMELLRYRKYFGWMNEILHFILGSSLRKHEMDGKFTGSFYYFLGVTATAALYPKHCATMGILQLAIADPTASYFGRQTRHVYWSRIENGLGGIGRNKGFLGFLGGALACVPFNYRLLSLAQFASSSTSSLSALPGGQPALLLASLALGMAGAFADLAVPTPPLTLPKKVCGIHVPPFHVDDNFVVPIVSGFACTKIFNMFRWSESLELAKFMWI